MSGAIKFKSFTRGPITYLEVIGVIDESFNPDELLTEVKGTKAILNLKDVSRMSSFGVREWTNGMRRLCEQVERVYWVDCAHAIVSQLNLVANFAGTAKVLSVRAPFFCETCGTDTDVKCNVAGAESIVLPEVICTQCNQPMEIDEDPDTYFSFPDKNKMTDLAEDPSIQGFLRHFADSGSGATSSHGEVPSQVTSGVSVDLTHASMEPSVTRARPLAPPIRQERLQSPNQKWLSFGIGFVIAVGGGILVYTLLAGAAPSPPLSATHHAQFTEASQAGNFGEAWAVVKKADEERPLPPETKRQLKEQLKKQALAPFSGYLTSHEHVKAAALIRQSVYDKLISEDEAQELYSRSFEALMSGYERLFEKGQPDEAEKLLERADHGKIYPSVMQGKLKQRIDALKDRLSRLQIRKSIRRLRDGDYQGLIADHAALANTETADPEMIYVVAEAQRRSKHLAAAAPLYERLIEKTKDMDPPHRRIDDARFWLATHLAGKGKKKEARALAKTVLETPNSNFKSSAARFLRSLDGGASPRSRRRGPR